MRLRRGVGLAVRRQTRREDSGLPDQVAVSCGFARGPRGKGSQLNVTVSNRTPACTEHLRAIRSGLPLCQPAFPEIAPDRQVAKLGVFT